MKELILVKASPYDTEVTIESNVSQKVLELENQSPVVNAGTNRSVILPLQSVALNGSANDSDGTIVSYRWTKISGPSGGIITSPSQPITDITELKEGTYIFRLEAVDDDGASSFSNVSVIVNPAPVLDLPDAPEEYGTLMLSNGFDKLSDITNSSNQLGQGSISTSKYKTGPGSFKSLVNTSPKSNISSGWRSEVQYSSVYSKDGDPIVVEYDTMYEKTFDKDGLNVQWHGNAQGTSGQLSLWISGNKFMVMRNVGGNNIYQQGTLKSIQTNKWYKMRWEIKFTPNKDGYVRLYIDNDLYYSVTGKTSDGTGQYLKIGTNRWNVRSESIVYFDNLKIWKAN